MNRLMYLSLFAAVLSGSCAFTDYSLDRAEPDPRVEEMRRRMNVRLTRRDPVTDELIVYEPDAFTVSGELWLTCIDLINDSSPICPAATSLCYSDVCAAEADLCVANELLNYASFGSLHSTVMMSGTEWTVPSQSSPARAALANRASEFATTAGQLAASTLRATVDSGCALPAAAYTIDPEVTVAEALAASLSESLLLANTAAELETSNLIAVADGAFSDVPEASEGAYRAWSLEIGSRSEAAHHLLGGEPGLNGSSHLASEGVCPIPRLSPGAAQALDLLRVSAISPREILSSRAIDSLIYGWDPSLISGWDPADGTREGLLFRLSILFSAPHLDPAPPSSMTVGQFLEGFGLTLGDFLEAREYLAAEFRAFGRSLDMRLPPQSVTPTTTTDGRFPLYASTRNPPIAPSPAYWAALSRYRSEWLAEAVPADAPVLNLGGYITYDFPNYSSFLDAAANDIAYLVGRDTLDASARDILAESGVLSQGAREARAMFCVDSTSAQMHVRVHANWPEPVKSFALVVGHDGLQCAVEGTIEGVPCTATELTNDFLVTTGIRDSLDPTQALSGRIALTASVAAIDALVDHELYREPGESHVAPVFVVAQEPGFGGVPGRWTYVAGIFAPLEGIGVRCEHFAVSAEIELLAASAIAPSVAFCGRPSDTCAGISTEQRIPLENELTDDSTLPESSWRHYLTVAMESAERADLLGEDLIGSGLEMDIRAEAAVDELEQICGISVDMGSFSEMPAAVSAACDAASPCGDDYDCARGRCVVNPVKYAVNNAASDAASDRIAACLGDSGTVPWITVGAVPLCFWWDGSDPETVCAGAVEAEMECPREAPSPAGEAPSADSCVYDPVLVPPSGAWLDSPVIPLGYFVRSDEPPPGDPPRLPSELPCEELAALRRLEPGPERNRDARAVLESPFFRDLPGLINLAHQLTWEPAVGDFSHIRLNGVIRYSTGNPYRRIAHRWPCEPHPDGAALCPAPGDVVTDLAASSPLFCRALDSPSCPSDPDEMTPVDPFESVARIERSRMNDLLARAVLAARLVTGAGVRGMRVPFYPLATDSQVLVFGSDSPHTGCTELSETVRYYPAMNPATLRPQSRVHNSLSDTLITGGQAANLLTDFGCGGGQGARIQSLSDFGGVGLYVASGARSEPGGCTSIPSGAEWTHCPYESSTCTSVFDDAVDCDDPVVYGGADDDERRHFDRNIGLIVRELSASTNGRNPIHAAEAAWEPNSELTRLVASVLSGRARRIDLDDDFTHYWNRVAGGGDCRGNGSYTSCTHDAADAHLILEDTLDGNQAFIAPGGLTERVNAFETAGKRIL